jgi:putative endonuclease
MAFLISCGWEVEAHRFRSGRHEVDLVVRRGSLVAFVEVKTRRSSACGAPEESVSSPKQRSVAEAAELWRLRRGRSGDTYRFDVVTVRDGGRGAVEVEHIADAWRLDRAPR